MHLIVYIQRSKQCRRCQRYATDFNALIAMYVEDVENGICIQSYSFYYSCQRCQILWIIDQRLKIHTNMFLLITSLIFNRFSIRKKFWKAETYGFPTIPSNTVYIKVCRRCQDRPNTPKGCNTMYVKDGKRAYTHIFAHNFLNIQLIFNPQKVLKSWDLGLSNHTIKYCVYWACWRCWR